MYLTKEKVNNIAEQLKSTIEDQTLALGILEEALSLEDNICQVLWVMRFKAMKVYNEKTHDALSSLLVKMRDLQLINFGDLNPIHEKLKGIHVQTYSSILKRGNSKSKKVILDLLKEYVGNIYDPIIGLKAKVTFEYDGEEYA